MTLNITSINAKSLNHPFKCSLLWKEALSQHADVLCVQETHIAKNKSPRCSHKLFPHCFFANADRKSEGVMISVRSLLAFQLYHVIQDPSGRIIILSASFNNHSLVIVNLYAPNSWQLSFYKSVICKLQAYP